MSRWTAPPDRREVFLVLLAVVIFAIGYNFEQSAQLVGISHRSLHQAGLTNTPAFARDGRRSGYNDPLESKIVGDWEWEDGHVIGHLREKGQAKGVGPHSAFWLSHDELVFPDEEPVHTLVKPYHDVPPTTLVKHIPGHTILDNLVIYAGKVYIVTDHPDRLPELSSIVSTRGQGQFNDWEIVSTDYANSTFLPYAGLVKGVSFISAEQDPHHVSNTTLISLWRTYTSLDTAITSDAETTLPAPARYLWPHRRFFIDENPEWDDTRRRRRMDIGIHHYNLKASWSWMGVAYYEDWEDWMDMKTPWVFERVVLVDPASCTLGEGRYNGLGKKSQWWFEPIRKGLKDFFNLTPKQIPHKWRKRIVYLQVQDDDTAPVRLTQEAHLSLVKALGGLSADVEVLSTNDFETPWKVRMMNILDADLVLSAHGPHVMDFVYLKPGSSSHLVELFPGNWFDFEYGNVATELGMTWIGWVGNQKFTAEDTLPTSYEKPSHGQQVDINVGAIVRNVGQLLGV